MVTRYGEKLKLLNPLKRYNDGTPFEDVLIQKLIETARDYSLDGFQIAEGSCKDAYRIVQIKCV
jgi:hypothetical protein